jgi:hypothetical protein
MVDCSNISTVLDQRNQLAFFHRPPPRYQPASPYFKYTKQQLDMRRKAEILKYNASQQNTKTNNLSKKELYALLARGGGNRYSNSQIQQMLNGPTCPADVTKPTPTSFSDVPGPPMNLHMDPTVPLYHYVNESILNSSYSSLPDTDTTPFRLETLNELEYFYQTGPAYVQNDPVTVYYKPNTTGSTAINTAVNQVNYMKVTKPIGKIVTSKHMPTGVHNFSLSVPLGIWLMASRGQGILDLSVCPETDSDTMNEVNDPSHNIHIDPVSGTTLDYLNACYSKLPGIFDPSGFMTLHIMTAADYLTNNVGSINIKGTPTIEVKYSGQNVTPLSTPVLYSSQSATDAVFSDVSFNPYYFDTVEFYGVQYAGNLFVDNLKLQVQPEQVYDLFVTMYYYYDYQISTQFDFFQSGIFVNLDPLNLNVADGMEFSSIIPFPYLPGSFETYVPDSIVAATSPYITNAIFGAVNGTQITLINITGNFDFYRIIRTNLATNDMYTFYSLTASTFLDKNLSPDTSYSYTLIPQFNHMLGSIYPVGTQMTHNIFLDGTSIVFTDITMTSITISNIVGNFTNYTMDSSCVIGGVTFQRTLTVKHTGSTFVDTGLVPGATYSYTVTPYSFDTPGFPFYIGSATTYAPLITSARFGPIQGNSVSLVDISGYYDVFSVIRDGPNPKAYLDLLGNSFTDIGNGLQSGQLFYYSIVPTILDYNGNKLDGPKYYMPSVVKL